MNLYAYRQNNSGGHFTCDDNVTALTIIEAESVDDANKRAHDMGIYFNGCERGIDCYCCGDRWDQPDTIDSPKAESYLSGEDPWITPGYFGCNPSVIAHYADGSRRSNMKW